MLGKVEGKREGQSAAKLMDSVIVVIAPLEKPGWGQIILEKSYVVTKS